MSEVLPPAPEPASGYALPPAPTRVGAAARSNPSAIASLVIGALSIVSVFACCCVAPVGGIIAVVLGRSARHQIEAAPDREGGAALATAGVVMGWISIVAGAALVIVFTGIFALAILGGGTNVVHQPTCFGC